MIEAPDRQGGYGIQVSDRNMHGAIATVAQENAYHPVREMLTRMTWDGIPRVDHLFVDYLGCPDDAYHRQMARLMLLGAVTRIFEPGHKFDFVPILEGGQGIGKSSFIEGLALGWKSDLSGEFHDDKRMVEQMQGSWIIEIPELQGFSKAEITTLKAFITRSSDKVRLSYERKTRIFPRQSVFVGSTNEKEYLRDDKNRRYLPVKCAERQIDIARLEDTIPLIWAEAVHIYREMRARQERGRLPLYPTGEVKRMAEAIQEDRRVIPEDEQMAGEIAYWLDQPVDPAPEFDELEDSPRPRSPVADMREGDHREDVRPAQRIVGSSLLDPRRQGPGQVEGVGEGRLCPGQGLRPAARLRPHRATLGGVVPRSGTKPLNRRPVVL